MTIISRQLPWLALFTSLVLVSESQAQFVRGNSFNPYAPAPGPSGGAYLPGLPGYPTNSVIFGRFGPFGPPTVSFPTATGRYTFPFDPRFPITVAGLPATHGGVVGYTTGSADSAYAATQTIIDPASAGPAPKQQAPGRNAFDRWIGERERARRPEALQIDKSQELMNALGNASQGDITSGNALNTILEALAPLTKQFAATQPIPLDPAFLKKINFTRGAGSVGVLRDGGKISWPKLLLNLEPKESAAKLRAQIEERFQAAFDQVNGGGKFDPEEARNLLKSIDQLADMASARAQAMTFADNLEVKRFLKALEDGVAFLRQPDAADWLPGKQKVLPATLQELVRVMTEKSVRFAPALLGNDGAYLALHRALVGLHGQAAPAGVRP
jgi:hypothetical protein